MPSNINIPLTGRTTDDERILCTKCGINSLLQFPTGFSHPGVFFHKDYTCYSYINCGGRGCNNTWLQCFVCEKQFPTKQGYERHSNSSRHLKKVVAVKEALNSGTIKTRRGCGTKISPANIKSHGLTSSYVAPTLKANDATSNTHSAQSINRESLMDMVSPLSAIADSSPLIVGDHDVSIHEGVSLDTLIEIFGKENNNANFYRCESVKRGSGSTHLLQKAFNLGEQVVVSNEEQRFVFELTNLLLNMTLEDRAKLGYIIGCVVDRNDNDKNIFRSIRVPRSSHDFDSILLSGKDSIVKNIPRPTVQMTKDGTHAFVSLVDVIAHVLATDTRVEALPSKNPSGRPYLFQRYVDFKTEVYTPITGTIAAKILSMELHRDSDMDDILYLFMKEWSDDFDPSHTKSNRAQAWMKTYTISAPTRGENKPRNTCITILGSKGDDHDPVEELFTEDLSRLSSGAGMKFYHGGLNRIINVKAGVLTTCVDRPERTKLFGIGDHNGTYSTCWGVSTVVDVSGGMNSLSSCNRCRIRNVKAYTILTPAVSNQHVSTSTSYKKTKLNTDEDPFSYIPPNKNIVLDDESDSDHYIADDVNDEFNNFNNKSASNEAGTDTPSYTISNKPKGNTCTDNNCASWNILDPHMSFPVPKTFPMKADNLYTGSIPSGRDVNRIRVSGETWLVTVNLTLPWLENAAKYAFHHVVRNGEKKMQYHWNKQEFFTYCRTCGFTNALSTSIESAAKSGSQCPVPTRWKRERALEKCHYAAMHMLFLGHVKSNMELFSKWLTINDLLARFGKQVNPMLINVRDLRMRRFHALPLSTSSWGTGPWVSENYVFWQRTWKYFFGYPIILDNNKFDKPSLRIQLNVVKRFVASSHACISAIMTPSSEGSDRMRKLIPIYLDTMVEMDNMIRSSVQEKKMRQLEKEQGKSKSAKSAKVDKGKQKLTATYAKSNSLGLLAVADAHDYFGSAAMNWEGGEEGERKIQQVKPLMGIRRKNAAWQKLALQKIYTSDSINWLIKRLPETKRNESSMRQSSLYRVYKDKNDAMRAVTGGGAISMYESKGGIYILYRPIGEENSTRSSYGFMKISLDDAKGEYKFGCWFSALGCCKTEKNTMVADVADLPGLITKNILALPMMGNDPSSTNQEKGCITTSKFYLISDDWDERVSGGHFIKSHITDSLFNSWIEHESGQQP